MQQLKDKITCSDQSEVQSDKETVKSLQKNLDKRYRLSNFTLQQPLLKC